MKGNNQREKKSQTPKKKKKRRIRTLTQSRVGGSIGLWWLSPRFARLKRREKQSIGFKLHSIKKIQRQMVKKATRSNQQGAYPSEGLVSRLNRKKNWLMRSLSRRTQRQKPKKLQIWKVSRPKEAGALLPKEKSIIALCVRPQKALVLW